MNRCALCPGQNSCVSPSGPDSEVIFIGEAPGKDENRKGIPFTGKTGREVNEHYLPLAGLRRDDCRFDNAIKCLPVSSSGRLDSKSNSDLALLQSCTEAHLYPSILRQRPKLIVAMGAFACRAIDPAINLDLHHGFPMETIWGTCFPMWHPAGGVHEPKKMLQIRNDWIRLKAYLKGSLRLPVDEYPEPDYQEATAQDINDIDPTLPMSNDTESSRSLGPYFYTYSQVPGTGRLIRADRTDLLELLQRKLSRWESILIWHNWLYDYGVVTKMGLRFPDVNIRDTMFRAFHLGNLPQGLKALAWRLLGMEMMDFEDLVAPYSTVEVIKYYRQAFDLDWPKPEEQLVRGDDGQWKVYKPQSMKTKLRRFFTDYVKKPDKDVFKAWGNWGGSQELIEETMGYGWPGMDICHTPFQKSLFYACRDADSTLRLWTILEGMTDAAMAGKPQDKWMSSL